MTVLQDANVLLAANKFVAKIAICGSVFGGNAAKL